AASEEAFAGGRLSEARSLVFAGGQRWQNEAYWMLHTGHDALASAILAQSGERAEAIRRLDERTDLNGPAAEVLEWLREGRERAGGGRGGDFVGPERSFGAGDLNGTAVLGADGDGRVNLACHDGDASLELILEDRDVAQHRGGYLRVDAERSLEADLRACALL